MEDLPLLPQAGVSSTAARARRRAEVAIRPDSRLAHLDGADGATVFRHACAMGLSAAIGPIGRAGRPIGSRSRTRPRRRQPGSSNDDGDRAAGGRGGGLVATLNVLVVERAM